MAAVHAAASAHAAAPLADSTQHQRPYDMGAPAASKSAGDAPQPPTATVGGKRRRTRTFKVILLGDAAVGKTCLSFRFCNGRFPEQTEATIGVDFRERLFNIDRELIRVQLWDTAGQERFRHSMTAHYYRNVNAAVFVYDVTRRATFASVAGWMDECRRHVATNGNEVPMMLVGNKSDEPPAVGTGEAQQLADKYDMPLFETSAKADSQADYVESILLTLVHKLRHARGTSVRSADERSDDDTVRLDANGNGPKAEAEGAWCGCL